MRRLWPVIVCLSIALAVALFQVRESGDPRRARAASGKPLPAAAPGGASIAAAPIAEVPERAGRPAIAVVPPAPHPPPSGGDDRASPGAPSTSAAPRAPETASRDAEAKAAADRDAALMRAMKELEARTAAEKAAPPATPAIAVFGTVRDASGAPIAGAIITAFARGDYPVGKPATTDATGGYSFPPEGLSDGAPHRVRAEHPRFRPREVGLPPRRADEPPTECDIALDDGPAKSGRALLEGGMPAAGASVTVIGRSGETIADRDGFFVLPVVASGRYVVVARLAPRLAAIGIATVDGADGGMGGDGAPLESPPLQLVLRAESALDASGIEATLPGAGPAQVQLWAGARTPLGPPPFAVAPSGADGAVHFVAVPPGRYVVSIATPAIGYLSPDPTSIDLAPGAHQEVWLGHRGTALLIVTARRDSGPPAHAIFSAWGDGGGSSIVNSTNATARMEGLPADRYFVFCNDQEGGLGRDWLTLEASEVRTLDLPILKAGRLTGVLVDEDAKPAVGARVTADTMEGGIQRQSIVDAQGAFALEMIYPGKQVIRASLDGRTTTLEIDVGVGENKGPIGLALGQ